MEKNSRLQSQLHARNLREIAAFRSLSALKQDLCAAKQHASDSAWGVPALQQLAEQHAADVKVPSICMPCFFCCPVCLLHTCAWSLLNLAYKPASSACTLRDN